MTQNPFDNTGEQRVNFPDVQRIFDEVAETTMDMSDADGERTLEWSIDTLSHLNQHEFGSDVNRMILFLVVFP